MKKIATFFLFGLTVCALFSCKKDNTSVPDYASGISGGWKYITGATSEKYLLIYKNRTFSILSSDNQGIRDRVDGILLVTNNQMVIEKENAVSIFNYKLNGNNLTLSQPSQNITLSLDKTAPDTTAWIKELSIAARTKAPISETTDITYDGSLIWYGNGYSSDYLYKINPTNFSKDSVKITQYAFAVEADGNDLWVSNDGGSTISRINKATGTTINSSTSLGSWIYGIAKDNNYLWCYSHNEEKLYKYNITSNTVDLTTSISSSWEGLALTANFLYVASNGKLHKCSLSPLTETASFELRGYHIYGVAYDGNSFWVSAYALPNQWPEIIKLSGVD
jgi:hypothetical protein